MQRVLLLHGLLFFYRKNNGSAGVLFFAGNTRAVVGPSKWELRSPGGGSGTEALRLRLLFMQLPMEVQMHEMHVRQELIGGTDQFRA